ncbi:MAG: cation:proton antiporter [Spirochaetaceae bacterium]|jgi:Kef-type K+ transport system membrane component KefB/mannitol/fructose-specific phosphotransferase system IIA component (Ntr-type)|nr:cation:proton antiporter [Spirochaetaceae bacterium]
MSERMAELVLQLGFIFFAVRICGRLARGLGIPPVLGELLSGVIIGPYALGGLALPGFPRGFFPLEAGPLAVSAELYAFATVASIILLFASGLETDLGLFLRYSLAGGVIGIGGVAFSFVLGDLVGIALLHTSFMDPRCLFLGILSTATSVGITARILSDHKRMDSPEGVTILAAAVFDDVLGIIMLAVVLGIVAVITGGQTGLDAGGIQDASGALDASSVLGIAGKAFGIWLGFTILGLVFSKKIAAFLKFFKQTFDFSILALGLALILAGIFEKQGLAMIIGAYISGLSLSKTDIAAVIQERLRGLYEFFVPIFFAVMGMMVNVRDIFSFRVLSFGALYTAGAVLAKIAGCGGPALLMGFNLRGALRIGAGMVPRGEVALIIAGIGLASGILDNQLFAVIILMTLVTTLAAPPLLSLFLKNSGSGTKKPVKGDDSAAAVWEFHAAEIADMVLDTLLKDLKAEGFYVQMMNIDEGISQARKGDISLSITKKESAVTIETSQVDMPFIKTAVYEVILGLHDTIQKLKSSSDPRAMKQEISSLEGRTREDVLSLIDPGCILLDLKGNTKGEIITEMVDLLDRRGKLLNRDEALGDVLQREKTMSTGMEHGIALPHGKSEAVADMCVAVGIKKEGVDFESLDGEKSRLFIMVVSPKKISGPHIQFLAAIGAVLKDETLREQVINADFKEDAAFLLQHGHF